MAVDSNDPRFLRSLRPSSRPSFTRRRVPVRSRSPYFTPRAMRRAAQSLRAREKSPLHRHYAVAAAVRSAAAAPSPSRQHQQFSAPDSQTERSTPSHVPSRLDRRQWKKTGGLPIKTEWPKLDDRLEEQQTQLGNPETLLDLPSWVQDDVRVPSQGSSRDKLSTSPSPSQSFVYEPLPRIPPPFGSKQSSADPRLLSTSQSRRAYQQKHVSYPYVSRRDPLEHPLELSDPRFDAFVAYRDRSALSLSPFCQSRVLTCFVHSQVDGLGRPRSKSGRREL
jgi:hypothetical protein